jgi:hypothetical protein
MNQTTGQTFSMERAAEIVQGAFSPLHCVAQTVNFGSRIEFEVTDDVNKRIFKGSITADLAQKDYNLRTQILGFRRSIEDQGIKLDPWELPSE